MNKLIILSPKHGVNPAIPVCFLCGEDKNMVILAGRLMGDAEAPRHVVWDSEPCDKCKEYMEKGVICISIKNGETNHNNPYRTGGWCVITAEAVTRMPMDDMLKKDILNKRMMFVEDVVWDSLGFPRGEISEVKEGA